MRIEAVTVCVGYADFLNETARHNRHVFDRWIVITRLDDKETIATCKRHNLHCLTNAEFGRAGEPFNKGRAISIGMTHLSTDAWNLQIDADIVLPSDTRRQLEIAHLDPACLYGVDRICLHSWDEWKRLESSGYLHDQHGHHLVTLFPEAGEPGARVVRGKFGWVPIGYFQLWHGSEGVHEGMRWKDYPDNNSSAAHSDIKFALHWDRRNRVLIPEIIALHLESTRQPYGVNWGGRKTPPFGPPRHHHPKPPHCPPS